VRRDELLAEMGLGPVWRLRARAESGAAAPASVAPAAGASTAVASPGVAAPSTDERAARIARMPWDELKSAVSGCTACGLCKTRNNTVFGTGDESADWMLVGEAPGAEEDERGEPFVGQAGRLLDSMLAAIGLKRGENVYIANVLKCRPPGNRNPDPAEVRQCAPHLARQIELVQPKVVVALGRFAAQMLLESDASIGSLRGKALRYRGVPAVVTYHPAYLLRNLPDKAKAWEDLCFARKAVASA
jgi:uracil-DNA glycosylase family 4